MLRAMGIRARIQTDYRKGLEGAKLAPSLLAAPGRPFVHLLAELRVALARGFARTDIPTVIEAPVGPLPSAWEFIDMPRVRGS